MTEEWTRDSIRTELQTIAQHVETPATAHLVGGGAMVLRGFKQTTRDIDLVVASEADLERLEDAVVTAGLQRGVRQETASARGDLRQFRDDDGRGVDLAHLQLGDGLLLSEGIVDRSDTVLDGAQLTVAVISPEDIYLRKLISGRKKDLLDSKALLQASIDTDVITRELQTQRALLDRELPSVLSFDGSTDV